MVALRRLASAAALALAALALGGCEKLCGPSGIGVFCPETEANPLNHAPVVDGGIKRAPASSAATYRSVAVCSTRSSTCSIPTAIRCCTSGIWTATEASSPAARRSRPSTAAPAAGGAGARQRLPQHIGAPGEVERTLRCGSSIRPATARRRRRSARRRPRWPGTLWPSTPAPRPTRTIGPGRLRLPVGFRRRQLQPVGERGRGGPGHGDARLRATG